MAINVPGFRPNVPNVQAQQPAPNVLPLVATLPPAQAQQNQQLLAQFPQLVNSMQAAAQGAPTSPVTVVIAPEGKSPDRFNITVQTTGDGNAAGQASQAISRYISSCCGQIIKTTHGGVITVQTKEPKDKQALDAALKDINTLSALVQHVGGDAQMFAQLLQRPDCAAGLKAFQGDAQNPPQVVLQQAGNNVLVVVMGHAQVESLGAAAQLLFAGGANGQAMTLLGEAYMKSKDYAPSKAFIAGLLQGHWPTDASRATEALKSAMWLIDDDKFAPCMKKVMQELFDAGHSELALELALANKGVAQPATRMARRAELLEMVFDLAMKAENAEVAEEALNQLGELGDAGAAAFKRCEARAQTHNEAVADPEAELDEHRQALEASGFSVTANFAGGALKITGTFVPKEHANVLLNYAEGVADVSLGPRHAAQFGAPVANFLIEHFKDLPQDAKVRLAGVCGKLIDKTDSPDAIVRKLQLAIETELLQSAIAAATQASPSSSSSSSSSSSTNNNPGVNALVWLLAHKDELFGALQSSGVDVAHQITRALETLGVTAQKLEVEIDVDAALATLEPALSPSSLMLLVLFDNSQLAATSQLTQASRQWFASRGGYLPSVAIVLLRQQLKVPLQDEQQWQQLQTAFLELLDYMQDMVVRGAPPEGLASIYVAVIDTLVELVKLSPAFNVATWCIGRLDELARDQALLAQASKAKPKAAQWTHLAVICAKTIHAMATEGGPEHAWGLHLDELTTLCKSDTALDDRLEMTIRLLINAAAVAKKPAPWVSFLVMVARQRLVDHGDASKGVPTLPLKVLMEIKQSNLVKLSVGDWIGFGGVDDADALCYLLTALSDFGMDVAEACLSEVAAMDFLQPTDLFSRGYLHLAKLFQAKKDTEGMLTMFTAALAHLPRVQSHSRREVQAAFTAFINSLSQTDPDRPQIEQRLRELNLL